MKLERTVALRAVSMCNVQVGEYVEWRIVNIYESVAVKWPIGKRQDHCFRRKNGELNAAAQNAIQFAMKDVALGMASKVEIHFKEYCN